jgi:ATP/maltotriose-dependent transcriptional regulator MalT
MTGAPGDAADRARGAVELLTGSAFTVLQAQSGVLLACALRERGELESAERALASGPAQESSGVWFAVRQAERGALALARGDHREARTEALAAGVLFGQIGARNWFPSSWRTTAALALRTGGEVAEAGRLAAEQVSDARRFGAAGAVGSALRAEGAVLDDLDRVLEAERLLASSPLRLEHARALVDIGAAMRRRGERARAREPLYTGMEIAGRCGAEPLAERALTELRATGARPRKMVRSGTEALTASERRVAVLAASGRTNREIAGELFITMATVETHLRSTFRKLDVRSRIELGDRLQAGEGATAPG